MKGLPTSVAGKLPCMQCDVDIMLERKQSNNGLIGCSANSYQRLSITIASASLAVWIVLRAVDCSGARESGYLPQMINQPARASTILAAVEAPSRTV